MFDQIIHRWWDLAVNFITSAFLKNQITPPKNSVSARRGNFIRISSNPRAVQLDPFESWSAQSFKLRTAESLSGTPVPPQAYSSQIKQKLGWLKCRLREFRRWPKVGIRRRRRCCAKWYFDTQSRRRTRAAVYADWPSTFLIFSAKQGCWQA